MALISYKVLPDRGVQTLFHSKSIPDEKNGYIGQNISFWSNKNVDRIINELKKELNQDRRRFLEGEFNRYFSENLPSIPLLNRPSIMLTKNKLVNIRFPGANYHSSLFSSGWSAREEMKDVF